MDYTAEYDARRCTAEEIAARVRDNWRVCADVGVSNPKAIYDALGARARTLTGVTVDSNIEMYPMPWYEDFKNFGHVTGCSWFSNAGARKAVNGGYADVMPIRYCDGAAVIRDYVEVDALCLVVSPMDKHGFFSMGASGSFGTERIRKAKHIFLEVNRFMPRSLAGPQIHVSAVTALCEHHVPLPELPAVAIDAVSQKIGELIAERIEDGDCLQLGIGAIPNAVGFALKGKRNLGIHTEMLTDSLAELLDCGAADNSRKQVRPGKSVATFALGSRRVYDLIDDNPSVEILPSEFVNDPRVICQNRNVVSVNSAIEVDFYGQVCGESVGVKHISGSGGQPDFVRGAILSENGRSFIAFSSTAETKHGDVSRVVPVLAAGAVVTTNKNDVDMVVTEYGVAKLRGQTLSARVRNLIAVAHPQFREQLLYTARERGVLV
ncbi:MAG: 4-hydroxybutyrate--acetyl-CoA CoA transferase [Oscillospiraceae bacterium]|jgi:acyl-CoA hydrolase|nr:4-hydroxybutyrate--acetyl-CoA CoA transferase [Oscillospiraceae bacterium]